MGTRNKKLNKIRKIKNPKELYEFGFNNGYGKGLGGCISYLRKIVKTNVMFIVTPELIENMKISVVDERERNLSKQFV